MKFDNELQDRLAKTVSSQFGYSTHSISRFAYGTAAVYRINSDRVLKLYHPEESSSVDIELEKTCLESLFSSLNGFTPQVIGSGKIEGIDYLLMSLLEGEDLVDVWSEISLDNRVVLFNELGKKINDIHSINASGLAQYCDNWDSFLDDQLENCVANQNQSGLRIDWLRDVESWIKPVDWQAEKRKEKVILHTEIMRDHLKVVKSNNDWKLAGIFDFGDVMVGPKEYDFVGVGCLATGGEGRLLEAFFNGYGYRPDKQFKNIMMAYLFIHKYSNVEWFLKYAPLKYEINNLVELAEAWYGGSDD